MVRNVVGRTAVWLCLALTVSLVLGVAFTVSGTLPAQKRGGRTARANSPGGRRPSAPRKEMFPRCKTEVKSDEILVKFNKTPTRESLKNLIEQIAKDRGFKLKDSDVSIREVGSKRTLLLIHVGGFKFDKLLSEFTTLNARKQNFKVMVDNDLEVVYAEPNFILYEDAVPNDTLFSEQWGMMNSGVGQGGISAVSAWDKGTGSRDIVVGVVDSGLHFDHPDLTDNVWDATREFTVPVGDGVTCPKDTHGFNAFASTCDPSEPEGKTHGTRVAGIIGARGNNDNLGVAGVNWTTSIMGLRTNDDNGEILCVDQVVDAISFAIEVKKLPDLANVRVLNNSYGYLTTPLALAPDDVCRAKSLEDIIRDANAADILFVTSAGDGVGGVGINTDVAPHFPSGFNIPNVIAVTATTNIDTLARFSNFGFRSVHLGAPGVNIITTNGPAGFRTVGGTSFAAPFVSGAAALILSHCPRLTTAALKACILDNADKVPGLSTHLPSGRRLNVNRAIEACGKCLP